MQKSVRERGKERRRHRILEAARAILMEEGLEGLSTRKLADRADVSVVTLYNTIGSKDDILSAILEEQQKVVHEAIEEIEGPLPVERIIGFVLAVYEIIDTDSESDTKSLTRAFLQMDTLQKFSSRMITTTYLDSAKILTSAVAEAQGKGLILEAFDASLLADQIFRTTNAIIRDWALDRLETSQLRNALLFSVWTILVSVASRKTRAQYLRNLQEANDMLAQSGFHRAYSPIQNSGFTRK